ncbi:unnamed protein product [Adineta ricciae]|uniref:Uncharacterized protein n=1 Tax=Adineta ricciae TaxID=249248 RepID=A0A815LBX8_ADIRI|nr:unnamed protein product [Adineta ricciae]
MVFSWKVIITVFVLYTIAIDGNRARRHRRQTVLNANPNNPNQQPLPPNPQILNAQGAPPPQQIGQNEMVAGKQGSRQFYYPYQGQTGYGTVQGLNYPYAGAGVGSYQYGYGQYGQYGQGLGNYGAYYNQYPGSSSFYGGYNSGGYYNRPGYSNYYPSSGGNYYGGYYWAGGQKQNINKFTVFLSTILMLIMCLIAV